MTTVDGPSAGDVAARALAQLAGVDAQLDAVERALAELDERLPPTCARCGAVLVDVLLGERPAPAGEPGAATCTSSCAP